MHEFCFEIILFCFMMDLGPAPSFHPLFKTSHLNKLASDGLPLANRSEQQVGGVNVLRSGYVCLR